jgi:hypothetical protein
VSYVIEMLVRQSCKPRFMIETMLKFGRRK